MKPSLLLTALVSCLLLGACQPTDTAPPTEVASNTPRIPAAVDEVVKPGAAAVWNGSLEGCRTGASSPVETCLIDSMRADHASTEAVVIAQRLVADGNPGYISAWRDQDGVGIATLQYPFRANSNQGTWLIASDGKIVDVDVDAGLLPEDARTREDVQAFLAAHPDAAPFASAETAGTAALPDGGIRLMFTTPMRTCHACATDGTLKTAYDFDARRRFIGKEVVELR